MMSAGHFFNAAITKPTFVEIPPEDQIQAAELRTGLKFQQLDKTTRNLKDSKAILDGISSEIERADTFKVVSELNQSQTQLEASFSTVVRVNSLSLAKFLIR